MAKKKASTLLRQSAVYVNEIDVAIEKETYANADVIAESIQKDRYLKDCHARICEVLEIDSIDVSKYQKYETYANMVHMEIGKRRVRKREAEERKQKKEEEARKKEETVTA